MCLALVNELEVLKNNLGAVEATVNRDCTLELLLIIKRLVIKSLPTLFIHKVPE